MLTSSSRGALAFSAVAVTLLAGAALGEAGWDPFGRLVADAEAEPVAAPPKVTKTIVKQRELPLDPLWAETVRQMVLRQPSLFEVCNEPFFREHDFKAPATITVDSEGRVESVQTGVFDGSLPGACIERELRKMAFPSPPASSLPTIDVEVPLGPQEHLVEQTPMVVGTLDKELVRKVIHAQRQQIRYCYEMQLNRFPELAGKVTAKFVISATGSVVTAVVGQSTVKNAELEHCIVGRVKTWQFPRPQGGGIAVVTYPFVFQRGD